MRTDDGNPLYFTKENVTDLYGKKAEDTVDHWDKLHNMFSSEQVRDKFLIFDKIRDGRLVFLNC